MVICQIPNTCSNCLILSVLSQLKDVPADMSPAEVRLMVVMEVLRGSRADWYVNVVLHFMQYILYHINFAVLYRVVWFW